MAESRWVRIGLRVATVTATARRRGSAVLARCPRSTAAGKAGGAASLRGVPSRLSCARWQHRRACPSSPARDSMDYRLAVPDDIPEAGRLAAHSFPAPERVASWLLPRHFRAHLLPERVKAVLARRTPGDPVRGDRERPWVVAQAHAMLAQCAVDGRMNVSRPRHQGENRRQVGAPRWPSRARARSPSRRSPSTSSDHRLR